MSSNDRDDTGIEDVNQQAKKRSNNDGAVENFDSCDLGVPPSFAALSNDDPCVLTTVFETSKMKSFLYKIEPNMAKINAPSLELISTVAALVLKTLVEKAVLREQGNTSNQMCKKAQNKGCPRGDQNQESSLHDSVENFLITSNHLKRVVSANNDLPSLDFLRETFENFRDRDASVLPSKLHEYVPRKAYKRETKRSASNLAGYSQTTTLNHSDGFGEGKSGNNENSKKRLKSNHTGKDPSSLALSSKVGSDARCLEREIANATNAQESLISHKIIEDDDDYD
jgi:hypothetical protein